MKRRFLSTATQSGLSSILLVYSAIAHCGDEAFAKWAAAHALPITTVEAAADDSDLLPLKSVIGAARVVAYGEPAHGVHEPLVFRNRLFRFLVERMGFTAIALETGFSESISARSFVENGAGDNAETTARSGLGFSRNLEDRELIQWMRDYNVTASSAGHRKIRLYGIDITAGRLSGPRRAIRRPHFSLARRPHDRARNPGLIERQPPRNRCSSIRFAVAAAQTQFEISIRAIAKATHKNRKSLIARSSEEEYRGALHNIEAARQLAKCLPLTPPPSASTPAWAPVFTCRDHAMAENVQWALRNEGREGRLLVFAHNAHVMSWRIDERRGPRCPCARGHT